MNFICAINEFSWLYSQHRQQNKRLYFWFDRFFYSNCKCACEIVLFLNNQFSIAQFRWKKIQITAKCRKHMNIYKNKNKYCNYIFKNRISIRFFEQTLEFLLFFQRDHSFVIFYPANHILALHSSSYSK